VEGTGATDARGLRILLAHDLSDAADIAATLVASARWPAGTTVRIVTSPAGVGGPLSSFANLSEVRAHVGEVRSWIEDEQSRLATDLMAAGLEVDTRIIHGRPERIIVTEADQWDADLVVIGARGHGGIEATILGSVSRAVVEDTHHPVLVARGVSAGRVLLATDGSAAAREATGLVVTWPLFDGAEILLLAVGEPAPRYARTVLEGREWRDAFRDTIARSTDHASDLVEEALKALDAAGRAVDVEVRLGDVATEIASAVRDWPADLVVLGSGHAPFLQRLFVESAARKVLDSVEASVLVVRPPAARAQAQAGAAAEETSAVD
jgi:nucleotide-binding universal stress UspA family protein